MGCEMARDSIQVNLRRCSNVDSIALEWLNHKIQQVSLFRLRFQKLSLWVWLWM